MNEARPGFQIGKTEDGKFLAASVTTPFFCFYGDTEEEVADKADRAIRFFYSGQGTAFAAPVSQTKQIISFVPQKRVEVEIAA